MKIFTQISSISLSFIFITGCTNNDILSIFVAIIIVTIIPISKAFSGREKLKSLKRIDGFTITDKMISKDGKSAIALDTTKNKIAISYAPKPIIISYSELLDVELIENGSTIMKKSTSRAVGGFLGGFLVFGGAGAVVGGLTGNSKAIEKTSSIGLKIIINDITNPVHYFSFMDSTQKNGSFIYDQAKKRAELWHGKFISIINYVDKNFQPNPVNTHLNSVADELLKFNDLKEKGVLSVQEFELLKQNLLEQNHLNQPSQIPIQENTNKDSFQKKNDNYETKKEEKIVGNDLSEEYKNQLISLHQMVKSASSLFAGTKKAKALAQIETLCATKEEAIKLLETYKLVCDSDLINDLKKINSSYVEIRNNVKYFIDLEIINSEFPHHRLT